MSPIPDVLRQHWLFGLAEVSSLTSTSLKAWLTDGKFVLDRYDAANKSFVFIATRDGTMLHALAHDIGRMGGAAFESIYGATGGREIARSTAWSLIRAYYSAFYGAHALLRIFGESVIQLESEHARVLRKAVQSSGIDANVEEGLHSLVVDTNNSNFTLCKLSNGPHEDTWNRFGCLLDRLIELSLKANPFIDKRSAQEVAGILTSLVALLRIEPCRRRANWLSYMRNEINYQHRHGAWFPHERANRFRTQVSYNLESWKRDPEISVVGQSPIPTKFAAGCAAIVGITRELIEELAKRNSTNNSFLEHSALLVLRQSMV